MAYIIAWCILLLFAFGYAIGRLETIREYEEKSRYYPPPKPDDETDLPQN